MTRAQRGVIEDVLERAEQGPSLHDLQPRTIQGAEQAALLWAQTWIVDPLRAVLDNEDGKVSALELRNLYRSAA